MDKKINKLEVKTKYQKMTQEINPKSKVLKDCINAFLVGGVICSIGQFINNMSLYFGMDSEHVKNFVPIVMIFIGAFLTGLGVYSKIAEFGGAGTVVPITGFSNAVVSPAIEFKKEGFIFGVAAKMFTIAGPVLVYGIGTSVIIGIIHYFIKIF
ncbi:stage V sporulation protein AC [Clostridium sp. BJN0001]|uniref:stage V sporulation protein AC n=1 Tax=Clostridium sp. BJN0001 TaxID=2930219 RepID=UPI001FD0718E|nr:stage V sporulation protein AC [Clostridium sp. BJN0001]